MTIDRDRIIDELRGFEADYAVDDFEYRGLMVWPSLRVWMGSRLEEPERVYVARTGGSRISRRVHRLRRRFRAWRSQVTQDALDQDPAAPADILLVTNSNRRTRIDARSWHPWADSLREHVEHRGLQFCSLEAGPPTRERAAPSAWIDARLRLEAPESAQRESEPQPSWFQPFAKWSSEHLAREVKWEQHQQRLDRMIRLSGTFEKWFVSAEPRLVFVDCWYNWVSAAAVLAAHRLGIRTVEFQHGLQSANHYGYNNWSSSAFGGSDFVPGTFWVWGNRNRDLLLNTNASPPQVVVGGNTWLNRWSEAADQAASRREDFTVLVTTQRESDYSALLEETVAAAPPHWQFMIRFHPKEKQLAAAREVRYRQLNPRVSVVAPTTQPLFAVLQDADVHATAYSTCTLEALAFGVPTVVWTDNGEQSFADLIAQGSARRARTAAEMIDRIQELGQIDRRSVRDTAEPYFRREAGSSAALDSLLRESRGVTSTSSSVCEGC